MCGITGMFSFTDRPPEGVALRRMNGLLTHRGPDAEGYYENRTVGLAMRRLKVIDLETGDQPVRNEDGTCWIVFNGEIYNYRELREALIRKGHRFHTRSDTEVIVHQFEVDQEKCLDSFYGMFAFAIYECARESLFLARDRLGIKPLYYHESAEGVAFASEIKSLLECPWVKKEIDYQALSHFLSLNYLPSPWTPFQGIRQLPPGHWMRVEKGKVIVEPYWEVPLDASTIAVSEEEALRKIEELFHRSIERRLIADVPVGAFLSGGIDSSAIVAFMKDHKHEKIKTFSVGFDHPSYDETPYAEEVARYFGTDHHEIRCSAEDVVTHLPELAWHADNLLADQAILPLFVVSRLAKEHVTVCLSGDGGDEVFVGYPTFRADRYHAVYSKIPALLRHGLVEPLVNALPASNGKMSFEYRAKKFIEGGDMSREQAHYWWRTVFTEREKSELLQPQVLEKICEADAFSLYGEYFRKAGALDFEARCLYADLKVWLAGNNLYKVDSMTMAHGLEARVPFLDHELVEYMARLPVSLKFKGGTLKYLEKKLLRKKLPASILARKKAGWHAPIGAWFRGPLRGYVRDRLLGEHPVLDGIVRKEYVRGMVSDHLNGRRNNSFKIWGLLVLHHWVDRFLSRAPQRTVEKKVMK